MESAWIAFAGVVVGSAIGVLASVITARLTARTQMNATALNVFLTARFEAYKDYEIASERLSNERDRESIAAFYRAGNIAALVASEETIRAISSVQEIVRDYEVKGNFPDEKALKERKAVLAVCMHYDLLAYPLPTANAAKSPHIWRVLRSRLVRRPAKGHCNSAE